MLDPRALLTFDHTSEIRLVTKEMRRLALGGVAKKSSLTHYSPAPMCTVQ